MGSRYNRSRLMLRGLLRVMGRDLKRTSTNMGVGSIWLSVINTYVKVIHDD
jgi:hypothetical protein